MDKVLEFLTETTNLTIDENLQFNEYILYQNYPNPFNPSTKIGWQMPEAGYITIIIYDVLGNRVKNLVNEYKQPGRYEIDFNASDLSSGVYFYQIQTGNFWESNKMMIVK